MKNIANMIVVWFIIFMATALFVVGIPQNYSSECTNSTHGHRSYPGICNAYYKCSNGQMVMNICNPGLNFNPLRGICDSSVRKEECKIAQRKSNKSNICPETYVGHMPDPTDSRKFIICFFGIAHFKDCKSETVYNNNTGKCELLEKVPSSSEKIENASNSTENSDSDGYLLDLIFDNNLQLDPIKKKMETQNLENNVKRLEIRSLEMINSFNSAPAQKIDFQSRESASSDKKKGESKSGSTKPNPVKKPRVLTTTEEPTMRKYTNLQRTWTRHGSPLPTF